MLDSSGDQATAGMCNTIPAWMPGVTQPGRELAVGRFFTQNGERENLFHGPLELRQRLEPPPDGAPATAGVPLWMAELNQVGKASDLQGASRPRSAWGGGPGGSEPGRPRPHQVHGAGAEQLSLPTPRCSADDSLASYAAPTSPDGSLGRLLQFWRLLQQRSGDRRGISGFHSRRCAKPELSALGRSGAVGRAGAAVRRGADSGARAGRPFDEATLTRCGSICLDLVGGFTDARAGAVWLMEQLALSGQGSSGDWGSPQSLTLDDIDTSELTRFCP